MDPVGGGAGGHGSAEIFPIANNTVKKFLTCQDNEAPHLHPKIQLLIYPCPGLYKVMVLQNAWVLFHNLFAVAAGSRNKLLLELNLY